MENNTLYPLLYACCIPVSGANRSIIYDLQRLDYIFIPNILFEILDKYRGLTLHGINSKYNHEHNEQIEEYFNFLELNEYLFYTDTPILFPKMNMQWDTPSRIYTSTLCVQKATPYSIENTLSELSTLGCRHILFVIDEVWDISTFENLINIAKSNLIFSIEINAQYHSSTHLSDWLTFVVSNPQIFAINFYNAPFTQSFKENENAKMGNIHFYSQEMLVKTISPHPNHFTVNMLHFTEAQICNTFYNRKVCIDKNGFIKNELHADKNFVNIKEHSITSVIEDDEFQKIWLSNKDNTLICKDCEYRYMCTDGRLPFFDEQESVYKMNTLCNYNPYDSTWISS